jgi:hypothetical protein
MKNKYGRSALVALLLLALMCTMFIGCGQTPDTEGTTIVSTEDSDLPETASGDGKVHLHVVAEEYDLRSMYVSALAELYNIRNEDVVVEVE